MNKGIFIIFITILADVICVCLGHLFFYISKMELILFYIMIYLLFIVFILMINKNKKNEKNYKRLRLLLNNSKDKGRI